MHKRLIQEGFNRRYVLLPLLLSIALVVLGFGVTEARRAHDRELDDDLRTRQDAAHLLDEAMLRSLEAESAQRGYLLTGDEQYLQPMDGGVARARTRLDELIALYRGLEPAEVEVLESVKLQLADQVQEMQQTVALQREGNAALALQLVKSGTGLHRMRQVVQSLEELRTREHERTLAGISSRESARRMDTLIGLGGMVFTIALLVVLGLMASRDIRRRENFAAMLAGQIDARTSELRDLSRHMSRVAEAEKHALARELHDELGGLLVVMRMDLSQIRKRLGAAGEDPQLKPHWERVDQALTSGLDLKRRVIEELRPTLLDNMGLFTALRWLASQRAEQAQLQLSMQGLDEDIDLPAESAIAVFRTVQEAVSNVVKHAGATQISVSADFDATHLYVRVADDGRGMPPDAEQRAGAHGLKQMRFRMDSVGGDINLRPNTPTGTVIELTVPLEAAEPA